MLKQLAQVFSVSTDYLLGLEHTDALDISGLSPEVAGHLRQLVDDLRVARS